MKQSIPDKKLTLPEYMNTLDVARWLKTTTYFVGQLVDDGVLPVIQRGKWRRFHRTSVRKALRAIENVIGSEPQKEPGE